MRNSESFRVCHEFMSITAMDLDIVESRHKRFFYGERFFPPDFLTNGAILITTELIKLNGKTNNDGFTATCVSCEFFPRYFSCVFNSFRYSR